MTAKSRTVGLPAVRKRSMEANLSGARRRRIGRAYFFAASKYGFEPSLWAVTSTTSDDPRHRRRSATAMPLAECHRCHATALAATGQSQVGNAGIIDRDEVGATTVRAIWGLTCSSSTRENRQLDRARQVAERRRTRSADGATCGGEFRVQHHEPAQPRAAWPTSSVAPGRAFDRLSQKHDDVDRPEVLKTASFGAGVRSASRTTCRSCRCRRRFHAADLDEQRQRGRDCSSPARASAIVVPRRPR